MFIAGLGPNFKYDLKKMIALSTLMQLGIFSLPINKRVVKRCSRGPLMKPRGRLIHFLLVFKKMAYIYTIRKIITFSDFSTQPVCLESFCVYETLT